MTPGGHAQLTGGPLDHGYLVTVMGSDPCCAHRVRPFIQTGRCSFQTGDLLNLPYPDRSFDTAIALRLMAHVNNWPRFLSELTRVARLLFGLKKAIKGNTRPYTCYTTRIIGDACPLARSTTTATPPLDTC